MNDQLHHEYRRFCADHPGTPLGLSGGTLRHDGETHRQAWIRMLRSDPCAYCGAIIHNGASRGLRDVGWWGAGTVDHIVPRDPLTREPVIGGKFGWLNLTGACESCNSSKSALPLLLHLRRITGTKHRELARKKAA